MPAARPACPHTLVRCINPYDTIRKYNCSDCEGVAMCACDEAFARRHLPHQVHEGKRLEDQQPVPVTLGFVPNLCHACRGLPEPQAPKAPMPGRTSKIHRYYWREIFMLACTRFADWIESTGRRYEPLLELAPQYADDWQRIQHESLEEIKRIHEHSPKYRYSETSANDVLTQNAVEVIDLDGIYAANAAKGRSIVIGNEVTSVEDFVARHFASRHYHVLVTESRPFHVLFACLLYGVICDPADPLARPASFGDRNAFERREEGPLVTAFLPSDFGTPSYADRRRRIIDATLSVIGQSATDLTAAFDEAFAESEPLRQYLWAHGSADTELARAILTIMPQEHVVRVLNYLIGNYWERSTGWPDLFVHRQTEYLLVEVKGSGDALSEDQKRWICGNHDELQLPFKLVKIHRKRTIQT